jgi:hypothetical protein
MALRQVAQRLAGLAGASSQATRVFAVAGSQRTMATESAKESVKEFLDKFRENAPSTMDLPSVPSDFLKPEKEVPATPPAKLTLNFYMPHEIEMDGAEVDSVQIPAVTGDMGVLPGHVPTVAQLRPGVVAVNMDDKETKKVRRLVFYFIPQRLRRSTRRVASRLRVSARHPSSAQKQTLSSVWRHGQIVISTQPPVTHRPSLPRPAQTQSTVLRQQRVRVRPRQLRHRRHGRGGYPARAARRRGGQEGSGGLPSQARQRQG